MVNSVKDSAPKKRSPCYSRDETVLLLELVEKYQTYIQTKSTNAVANHAKEVAWTKLARQFNNANLGHKRSAETLRVKWENMKRHVRNPSKNLIDMESSELDDINSRIIAMISESNSTESIEGPPDILAEEIDEGEVNDDGSEALKYAESDGPKDDDSDTDNDKGKRVRSQNFSTKETKLLLQCVKKEKRNIFNRETNSRANEIKNKAWARIADSYNKLSPVKRSTKVLKTKFESMKKLAKKIGNKDVVVKELLKRGEHEHQNHKSYEELMDESFKDLQAIKKEPSCEDNMGEKCNQFSDNDSDFNDFDGGSKFETVAPDPLSSVLHADSGMGSSSQMTWNWSQPENKEIIQLQKELLNYQMETAKLERKRVEDAIVEEARERESRALERSLRVRAARLEAAAGALRLPPAHPALLAPHPPEEARAHEYLTNYHS